MAVYDGSWYIKVLSDRFEKKMRESEIENCYRSICSFEKQITEDGTLLIKLFLDIDQKEQKKRFDKLMESKDTAWRVTKADLKKNEKYDQYQEMIEEMLQRTDTEYAPLDDCGGYRQTLCNSQNLHRDHADADSRD